jgi:hypothetical protein
MQKRAQNLKKAKKMQPFLSETAAFLEKPSYFPSYMVSKSLAQKT